MTPTPPARAIATAIRASHTVSMFAATTGTASPSPRASRVVVLTSARDAICERRGTSRTSS